MEGNRKDRRRLERIREEKGGRSKEEGEEGKGGGERGEKRTGEERRQSSKVYELVVGTALWIESLLES